MGTVEEEHQRENRRIKWKSIYKWFYPLQPPVAHSSKDIGNWSARRHPFIHPHPREAVAGFFFGEIQ